MIDDIEPVSDTKTDDEHNIVLWIINNSTHKQELSTLKNQINVMSFIKHTSYDKDLLIKCLTWLQSTTKQMCVDRKMSLLLHKTCYNTNNISRSSYFFCKYSDKCTKKCKKHHFVYDLLYADISALLEYINSVSNVIHSEITKSLNTINYVIYHMYNELQAKC